MSNFCGLTNHYHGVVCIKKQVLSELASGKLNSHTLISCENYALGFEYESVVDAPGVDISEKDPLLGLIKEKNGSVQPFNVRVSPDALFMADLHAHLADCEVIGLFGGRYVEEEKCLYIQVSTCNNIFYLLSLEKHTQKLSHSTKYVIIKTGGFPVQSRK